MLKIKRLSSLHKTPLLILAVLLQITILAVMVLNSYLVILWGEQIILKVEPIDPHSLFQGDYVRLGYGINSLVLSKINYDFDPKKVRTNDRVYLSLRPLGDKDAWVLKC